jgi:phospholipase C
MNTITPPTSPYKGLDHYEEKDSPFFFGRDVQCDLVIANLLATRLTLLYGESGVGKTSLLQAGVVPRLRTEPDIIVIVFRSWDHDPVARLSEAIRAAAGLQPSASESSLAETITECTEQLECDLIVILDQFEEYFTYHPQESDGNPFESYFSQAVNQRDLHVSFLISIREDALAWLDRFKGRIPNLFGNYLRVKHLDQTAAREAIRQPLGVYDRRLAEPEHLDIEPALVDAVLEQVRVGAVQLGRAARGIADGAAAGESRIEAPYLQLVLTRLWDEEQEVHSRVLRAKTLERLGGAERIIRTHLDDAMATLSSEERDLAARVFRFLVTPSGTKIAYHAADLADYAEATAEEVGSLLDRLSGQRLRILRGIADGKYEIYHDVLAAGILDWRARYLGPPSLEISNVVVLMLHGRSFDHMLGFLPHPDPAFDGLLRRAQPFTNPGWAGGPAVPTSPDAKLALPVAPDDSPDAVMEQLAMRGGRPTNRGFVTSYERKGRGLDPPAFGGLLGPLANLARRWLAPGRPTVKGRGPLAMACQPPENVPVLATLARQFAVCSSWFCSVPGGMWPNRIFAHAATSDGQTDVEIRPYTNRTVFELLEEHGTDWRIYHDETPQVWVFPALWDTPKRHANWFPLHRFTDHVAAGDLATYTFIEPNHRPPRHTLDHAPLTGESDLSNSQDPANNLVSDAAYDSFTPHGDSDFTRAEKLIATIYEALRANPELFDKTLLLVTYDEHGGLYDHVPPPTAVPSPGGFVSGPGRLQRALLYRKSAGSDFTMLGPRVPAIVISPRVPAGTVDTKLHDHASIAATLRALFAPGALPLTARDRWSVPFHNLATLREPRTDLPDLSAYARDVAPAVGVPRAARTDAAESRHSAMPAYYPPFLALAEQVRVHMEAVGEPEAAASAAGAAADRGAEISRAFAMGADRHRAAR